MEIKICGAGKEVTGSCYGIVSDKSKVLVDCGMFQGSKDNERKNYEKFDFNPPEYNALVLTHAHLDHCGRIPLLVKRGFRGKIYATDATKALAEIIMADSAKIAEEDTKNENKRRAMQNLAPRKPIYNNIDVLNTIKLFIKVDYDKEINITKNIKARFYDAGHILGSSSIKLTISENGKEKSISFSGDLGQEQSILVKKIQQIENSDYVFVESTYGDRLHEPIETRKKEFIKIINETHSRGGKLLIPSFAVERTQEILYYLRDFMQKNLIPKMPVFLDSPMAMRATDVFSKFLKYYNEDVQKTITENKGLFTFPELKRTRTRAESMEINGIQEPCIIIAGNGMCTAGRIKHHIRNNIEDEKNTLLFVGFQVEGTLGYWIKNGEKKIKLLGTEVDVKSQIRSIESFSGHADKNGLLKWIKGFKKKPKKVFITHGEEKQSIALSKNLSKIKIDSYIPSIGESINL